MRHGYLLTSLLALWLFVWSLDVASQRETGRPFQWPDASLGNPLMLTAFYVPPFVAAALAVSAWKNEVAEYIFAILAWIVLVVVVLMVAFMMFLNVAVH